MKSLLVTGGAGFIGINAAKHFAERGWSVTVMDNLSRRGAEDNLAWLSQQVRVHFERVDVRDAAAVAQVVRTARPAAVLHLAAQVAVTTSVADPRADFETNALGTLNMLEAVRAHAADSVFINASTNKVYGSITGTSAVERASRYELPGLAAGVGEDQPLDFHSPYGCSKGAADQYTLDYARIYGLDTVTLRQSCIYGPRQFGIEDQGWVAWFTIAAVLGHPVTLYGDGKQVRDLLHVDDLVRVYEAVIERRSHARGLAFNIGGGPSHTLSLLELTSLLHHELGTPLRMASADWRPGDQRVYVSDIRRAQALLGWTPVVDVQSGVRALVEWVRGNRHLFSWLGGA